MLNSKQKTMCQFRAKKTGKAVTITDNSTKLSTTAFYARMKTMEMDESAATRETWLQVKLR
jgi:hypothetical protein